MSLISVRVISGYCLTKRRDSEGREPGLSPCIRHGAAMVLPWCCKGGTRGEEREHGHRSEQGE
jgi:hypothetical protein